MRVHTSLCRLYNCFLMANCRHIMTFEPLSLIYQFLFIVIFGFDKLIKPVVVCVCLKLVAEWKNFQGIKHVRSKPKFRRRNVTSSPRKRLGVCRSAISRRPGPRLFVGDLIAVTIYVCFMAATPPHVTLYLSQNWRENSNNVAAYDANY